ncbi:hypothetical protein SNEBB_002488 [Seison nebaliae]|nr:hypothetical protein SNEBB_002488 [Seison nebaliae]
MSNGEEVDEIVQKFDVNDEAEFPLVNPQQFMNEWTPWLPGICVDHNDNSMKLTEFLRSELNGTNSNKTNFFEGHPGGIVNNVEYLNRMMSFTDYLERMNRVPKESEIEKYSNFKIAKHPTKDNNFHLIPNQTDRTSNCRFLTTVFDYYLQQISQGNAMESANVVGIDIPCSTTSSNQEINDEKKDISRKTSLMNYGMVPSFHIVFKIRLFNPLPKKVKGALLRTDRDILFRGDQTLKDLMNYFNCFYDKVRLKEFSLPEMTEEPVELFNEEEATQYQETISKENGNDINESNDDVDVTNEATVDDIKNRIRTLANVTQWRKMSGRKLSRHESEMKKKDSELSENIPQKKPNLNFILYTPKDFSERDNTTTCENDDDSKSTGQIMKNGINLWNKRKWRKEEKKMNNSMNISIISLVNDEEEMRRNETNPKIELNKNEIIVSNSRTITSEMVNEYDTTIISQFDKDMDVEDKKEENKIEVIPLEREREEQSNENQHILRNYLQHSSFFINNRFYTTNMTNVDNYSFSDHVRSWLNNEKSMLSTKFSYSSIDDVKLTDIHFRLGELYLYIHLHGCEHLFTFCDMAIIGKNQIVDHKFYPKLLYQRKTVALDCAVCEHFPGFWVVKRSDKLPVGLLLCKRCIIYLNILQDHSLRLIQFRDETHVQDS